MVYYKYLQDFQKVFYEEPWFWGHVGIFFKTWFYGFKPSFLPTTVTPIWVRSLNMLLHLLHPNILANVENSIKCFIKVNTERLEKGIVTFAQICVEINLSKGLMDKILIDWSEFIFFQPMDYEIKYHATGSVNNLFISIMCVPLLKGSLLLSMPGIIHEDIKIQKFQKDLIFNSQAKKYVATKNFYS